MSTQIDDQTLMAYADGELDAVQAARVEQAMQADAGIAARVAQHRALRTKLQAGLGDVLAEPVPQHLLDTLRRPVAPTARVVEFAQAKHNKATPHNWSGREWMAMAASLIAGVVIGMYALNFSSRQMVGARDGALIAQGRLDGALHSQLAGSADEAQSINIGISFRNRDGEYCRSFVISEAQPLAGLACRDQDQWRVQILTEASHDVGEFRQAASATPAAVLALIEQQIAGEPLDADAEAAAQRSGWQ